MATKTHRFIYDSADLPQIQGLLRLGREVHGGLELFSAMPLRTARRALAGDLTRRTISSFRLTKLLRSTWTASLLVKDSILAARCRQAVLSFARRAPLEVREAQKCGEADALYLRAMCADGAEREALLESWREAFRRRQR